STALDTQSIAEVVAENDIEAGEQLVLDVTLDADEPFANADPVVDVPVQNELAGGATGKGNAQLGGPVWRPLGSGHVERSCQCFHGSFPSLASSNSRKYIGARAFQCLA